MVDWLVFFKVLSWVAIVVCGQTLIKETWFKRDMGSVGLYDSRSRMFWASVFFIISVAFLVALKGE